MRTTVNLKYRGSNKNFLYIFLSSSLTNVSVKSLFLLTVSAGLLQSDSQLNLLDLFVIVFVGYFEIKSRLIGSLDLDLSRS